MTEHTLPELLPCPFCGGEAELITTAPECFVRCVNDHCCPGRNLPETAVKDWNVRAHIQATQDYLHEGRGFNCCWCGQRFAETQHGKFCANSDCTKSPSYKPPQAAQSDVRDDDLNWRMCGIIELAIRNPNVSSYMDHWEGRALKAEAALSKDDGLLEALKKIKDFPRDDTSPELFYWHAVKTAEFAIAAAASKGGA